jgi:hypothetical protein
MRCLLRYELDDVGSVGITLYEFNSLEEMDKFLTRFKDSDEVREYYHDAIDRFLKTPQAVNYLKGVTSRENNGYVKGYFFDKYNKKRSIGLLYQDELTIDRHLFATLRKNLEDRKILREIYDHKYFLLGSQDLKMELRRCVMYNGTSTYFIRDFVRQIENKSEEDKYLYVRCLCHVCKLIKKKKHEVQMKVVEVGKLGQIDSYKLERDTSHLFVTGKKEIKELMKYDTVPTSEREQVEVVDWAPEEFKYAFYKALDTGNFDMLFNIYSLDVIDRYTNLLKGKRK